MSEIVLKTNHYNDSDLGLDVAFLSKEEQLEQLRNGQIPQVLREEWQLLDENSVLGKEFQRYMMALTQGLLRDAGYADRADRLDLRFFLTNEKEPHAGIVTHSVPSVMMISKGLWSLIRTQDQLEAVLGHELGHAKIFEEIGVHSNSKGEEVGADIAGTELLYRAGRNPEALSEFLVLLDRDEALPDSWAHYVDPHPNTRLRLRLLENYYEALKEKKGLDKKSSGKPLDPEVARRYSTFDFKTPFSLVLEQAGCSEMSKEEQVLWFANHVSFALQWKEKGYKKRFEAFKIAMRSLRRSILSSPICDENDQMVEALGVAALFSTDHDLYDSVVGFFNHDFRKPHGQPAVTIKLDDCIRGFIGSESSEAAASAARGICEIVSAFDLKQDKILSYLGLASYELPARESIEKAEAEIIAQFVEQSPESHLAEDLYNDLCREYGVKMPWDRQVLFYLETENPEILQCLRLLGAKDPRLPELPDDPAVPELERAAEGGAPYYTAPRWSKKEAEAYPVISRPHLPGSSALGLGSVGRREGYVPYCEVTSEGYYVSLTMGGRQHPSHKFGRGFFDFSTETARNYETFRLARVKADQEKMVGRVHFSELQRDFWAFVSKNRLWLTPEHSFLMPSQPFQEKFLSELAVLLEERPEQFRPLAYEFFSGQDHETGQPILFDDAQGRVTLMTLLDDKVSRDSDLYMSFNKFYGGLPFGVPMEHPFYQFMLDDQYCLFPLTSDKLPALEYASFVKKNPEDGDGVADVLDERICGLLGISSAPSWAETRKHISPFSEWLDKVARLQGEGEEHPIVDFSFTRPRVNGLSPLSSIEGYYNEGVLFDYLTHSNESLGFEDTEFLFLYLDKTGRELFGDFLSVAMDSQILRNAQYDLSQECSVEELFRKYELYMERKAFSRLPEVHRAYQKALMARSVEIQDPFFLSGFLGNQLGLYALPNPVFKNWACKTWAESMLSSWQKSDEDYNNFVTEMIDRSMAFPLENAHPALVQFCEHFALQREHSYYAEKKLSDQGLRSLGLNNIKAIFSEALLDVIGRKPRLREQFIEYLSAPETEAATAAMVSIIEEEAQSVLEVLSKLNLPSEKLPPKVKTNVVRTMHGNYSSWPLEGQALFIEKVIFPVTDELSMHGGKTVTIDSEMDLIFDRVFPVGKESSDIAREYMSCHLSQLTDPGKRLYLAILMASAKERGANTDEVVDEMREAGRSVGRILGRMHPLGAKFAQEIESYPGTPEEFRQGLRDVDVKAGIDIPNRWDLWHLMDRALSENPALLDGKTVGHILGGGSVQVNVSIIDKVSGHEKAMALLREDVNERAKRQETLFSGALELFIEQRPGFSPLQEILTASCRNLKVETDYSLASRQSRNMQKIYDDTMVISDGIPVRFCAVRFHGSGQFYKLYDKAEGVHFNDLPVSTPQEVFYKRAIAKAIITRDLTAMLRGEAIDADRHGKQQKITFSKDPSGKISVFVQNFDDGAMALDRPTAEEKRVLGESLGKALLLSLGRGMSVSAALQEVTQEYKDTEYGHYIETVKKALRTTLGDYINASFTDEKGQRERLVSAQDIRDIFTAILKRGRIDPQILYPFVHQIGGSGLVAVYRGQERGGVKNPGRHSVPVVGSAFSFAAHGIQFLRNTPSVVIADGRRHIERLQAERLSGGGPLLERFNAHVMDILGRSGARVAGHLISWAGLERDVSWAREL